MELTDIFSILAGNRLDISVASKLISSNVVLFDPGTHKRRAHGRHHSGWPGNVVDGSLEVGQIPAQHLLVYQSRLALPFLLDFDISVMVQIKRKLGFVVSKALRASRKAASSGRRLE